ncbi:glycosyltransferase family 2 protein [Alistipes indistinctus]|uniref:glycosyltransferase family 2 protein n=1 Tax=Alistipes indistinctus TaxID=626932 RepID=UPI0026DB4D3A|nr:glycosyltransferase family 2 protein [Alistipes indistinctus]
MTKPYEVTVAIPVYNVHSYIERSLLSVLNQTFESIEILIIDDKGGDDSMKIVRQIARTHRRGADVRIIDHKVNRGTGATRNTAIEQAQGKYLYYMDGDDEVTPDCIETLYHQIKGTAADFCMASFVSVYNDRIRAEYVFPDIHLTGSCAIWEYQHVASRPIPVYVWNRLYRVSWLRAHSISCIPHHVNEDDWFSLQVLCSSANCILCSQKTYRYRIHDSSTMGRQVKGFDVKTALQYEETLDTIKQYLSQLGMRDIFPYCVQYLYRIIFLWSISVIRSQRLTYRDKLAFIGKYARWNHAPQYRVQIKYCDRSTLLVAMFRKFPIRVQYGMYRCVIGILNMKNRVHRTI